MSGRILIVEDDRSMAEMLEADLRLRDFTTVWCPTAEEALAQWQRVNGERDAINQRVPAVGLASFDRGEIALHQALVTERTKLLQLVLPYALAGGGKLPEQSFLG